MSCYQKFYTNQIHSSSLLCQLATMWKSQVLCDAVIRSGSVITKAHRVVLVAACPMLQSMENASMGSHLEVRLASDIKQDSIITFLQYLYEGFMMLTEENCRDVEKIARLLQVDSVIKCVSDFYKCLSTKTGCAIDDRFKYTSYDLLEFKHVRSSDIQKTLPEAALKRGADYNSRPSSPGSKRQRMHHTPSPSLDPTSRTGPRADDTLSMANSYGQARDPWDQRGRGGGARVPQPGVIDIVEDSFELIQTDESDRNDSHVKQKSVSVAVSSQYNTATDVRVVNVTDPGGTKPQSSTTSQSLNDRGSITVSPLPIFSDSASSSQPSANRPPDSQHEITPIRPPPPSQPVFPTLTPMQRPPTMPQPKPFAAGSASQTMPSPQSRKSDTAPSPGRREGSKGDGNTGGTQNTVEEDSPDLSIVKIESNNETVLEGLDMYVDKGDDGVMRLQGMDDSQNDEGSDTEQDQSVDWGKEDMSNEGSNLGADQNNSWYIDQFKEWLILQGEDPNFEAISPSHLNVYLCRYYQSVDPEIYPNLGFFPLELTRYLTGPPYYRDVNVMTNPEFNASNRILNSSDRPIRRSAVQLSDTPCVTFGQLHQLYMADILSGNDPHSLQNKVWLDINIYFGGFTRQLLRNMKPTSFAPEEDLVEGRRFYRLIDRRISPSCNTRMYEQPGSPFCPVSSLERYVSCLQPGTDILFLQPCTTEDIRKSGSWYSSQPIGKNQHSAKLSALCKHIGLNASFRNTSVRHLSRHVDSLYPGYTPAYSDKIFNILTGVEEDPAERPDSACVPYKRRTT